MKLTDLVKLNENADDIINRLQTDGAEQPLINLVQRALDSYEKYKNEGELIASEYKELRSQLSRALEYSWTHFISSKYFYGGKWESLPPDLYDKFGYATIAPHTLNSLLTKARKSEDHPLTRDIISLLDSFSPVVQDVIDMKNNIVKKKSVVASKEKEKDDYKKDILGKDDVNKIRAIFVDLTQKFHDEIMNANVRHITDIINIWQSRYDMDNKNTPYKVYGKMPFYREMVHKVTQAEHMVGGPSKYTKKENWKEIVNKMAKELTDSITAGFINKNTMKLGQIISKKKGMDEIKILNATAERGTIEATIVISFSDGASFNAKTGLVFAYSKNGKPFSRYPTTFHNVILANGSHMKNPSEERMNTEFI